MTNYERIKGMSVEEMAVLLADEIPHGDCYGCDRSFDVEPPYRLNDACQDAWLIWLEQEAESNDELR